MNRNIQTVVIALLLLAVGCGVAWNSYQARLQAETSLAALAHQRAALDAGVHAAESKISAIESERTALQAAVARMEAGKPAARAAAAPPARPATEAALYLANPDLFALYAKSFRANLPSRYGLIYQAIGLTSDQVDKVNDLFAQQDTEKWKLMIAAEAQGLDRSDTDIQALLQQLRAKYADSLVEIIGEPAAEQFHQLSNTLPLTPALNDMASLVAFSSEPVTTAQQAQLLQIMGRASGVDKGTGQVDPATIKWDDVLQQAQGVLSPTQLAALKVESELSDLGKANKQFYRQQPPAAK
jgi:hypothetical protein